MDSCVPFEWQGRTYYYAPEHHKIFATAKIPDPLPVSPRVNRSFALKSIWLNISAGCNLQCSYCFNPPPSPNGAGLMTEATARRAVIMLANLWQAGGQKEPPVITFFGGEPFLNREVMEYTIHFAREWTRETGVPFKFSMSTNATLLTAKDIALIDREQIMVQVSIDGPEEVHNKHRLFRSGKGSFEKALRNAMLLIANTTSHVVVRATAASGTCTFSESLRFLVDQGFKHVNIRAMEDNTRTGVAPMGEEQSQLEADADAAALELMRAHGRGVQCEPFNEQLESLRTGRYRPFVCGAGASALCVAPQGSVYPCHRFQDNQDYCIGNVSEPLDLEACRQFSILDTRDVPLCHGCWASRFCWGCCPGESVAAGVTLGQPNSAGCGTRKLEALISLKYAAARGYVTAN